MYFLYGKTEVEYLKGKDKILGAVIDNIEDKVRKIRVNVQIDRVDILFSVHIHFCSSLGIL